MDISSKLLGTDEARELEPENIFCWQYGDDHKSIRCFGAHHEFGFGEQAKKIIKVFEEYEPDCLVVEAYKQKIKNKEPLDSLVANIDENFSGNESQLGINLALKNNSLLVSVEPDHIDEIKEMLKVYSIDELMAFYPFRSMHFYEHEQKAGRSNSFDDFYNKNYQRYLSELRDVVSEYNPEQSDIFEIYKKWFGKSLFDLTQDELYHYVWPVPHKLEWKRSNDMARTSGNIRDRVILKNLENLYRKYNKVFLIYGKSHIPRWEKALCDLYRVSIHEVVFE